MLSYSKSNLTYITGWRSHVMRAAITSTVFLSFHIKYTGILTDSTNIFFYYRVQTKDKNPLIRNI